MCKNFPSFIAPSLRCTTRLVSCISTPSRPSPFFLLLFPYCFMWRLSCLFGSLRSSDSIQQVFCRSYSTCSCIFDVLGEENDPHVLLLCYLEDSPSSVLCSRTLGSIYHAFKGLNKAFNNGPLSEHIVYTQSKNLYYYFY